MLDGKNSVFSLGPYTYVKEQIRRRKAAKLLEKAELSESLRREQLFTATYCCQQTDSRWAELSWPRTAGGSCQSQLSTTPKRYYKPPQTSFSSGATADNVNDDVSSYDVINEYDPHLLICTTFWRESLTLNTYKWREPCVDFGSLWPSEDNVKGVLREARHRTSLHHAFGDLLRLCLRAGPLRVLKALIEEGIVDKNAVLDGGRTLLHTACIHGNLDAVLYLCAMEVDSDVTDHQGTTPRQLCKSVDIQKLLPPPTSTLLGTKPKSRSPFQEVHKTSQNIEAAKQALTAETKERIFDLFHDINKWEEVLLLLQEHDFRVNEDQNDEGDLLVHIATKKGISHVAALVGLTRHLGSVIDLTNTSGSTPLILAVCNDDDVMADVLLCVLGADVNCANPDNGWTALHYAVHLNSHSFVSLLVKRGADVNVEGEHGLRADDLGRRLGYDSAHYIQGARQARAAQLSARAAKGTLKLHDLYNHDLFMVDDLGDTLIMTAARNNRPEQLTRLLRKRCAPLDAQNYKTGQTALSIAAQEGHIEVILILLRSGAAPGVSDMAGLNTIQRAVVTGNQQVVRTLLEYPVTWGGLQRALKLARTRRLKLILRRTVAKRQANLVTPALFEAAMTGGVTTLNTLLEDGDDVNPASSSHDWPLYMAAAHGHLEVVRLLYLRGGDICCQHQTTHNTPLHVASAGNHLTIVDFLLEHYGRAGAAARRAAVNVYNGDGKTALQIAADKGYIRIVESLLEAGASSVLADRTGHLYQCRGYQGIQALLDQARRQHALQVFSALNRRKPVPHLQEVFMPEFDHSLRDEKGDTPLMVACYHGKVDAVNFLLQSAVPSKPSLSQISVCSDGTHPLDNISIPGQSQPRTQRSSQSASRIYDDLDDLTNEEDSAVELDYSPSQHTSEGWAYHFHATNARSKLSDSLSLGDRSPNLHGFGLNGESQFYSDVYDNAYQRNIYYRSSSPVQSYVCGRSTQDGATPLHRAIQGGDQVGLVTVLLQADAGVVNLQDEAGQTPLHVACHLGRRKCTQALLTQPGVDVNLRTLEGYLPEELTTNKSLRRLLQHNRQHGTDEIFNEGQDNRRIPSSSSHHKRAVSEAASSVSFDRLNTRFALLKESWLSKQRQQQREQQ